MDVDKAVMHAFYTAGHVLDVLSLFGEMDENLAAMKKYAKWKSTKIFSHLKLVFEIGYQQAVSLTRTAGDIDAIQCSSPKKANDLYYLFEWHF